MNDWCGRSPSGFFQWPRSEVAQRAVFVRDVCRIDDAGCIVTRFDIRHFDEISARTIMIDFEPDEPAVSAVSPDHLAVSGRDSFIVPGKTVQP